MFPGFFLLLLHSACVKCDRYYSADDHNTDRYIDVYTNHENSDEALGNFEEYEEPYQKSSQAESFGNIDRMSSTVHSQDSAYYDKLDFNYPQIEYLNNKDDLESEYGQIEEVEQIAFPQNDNFLIESTDDNRYHYTTRRPYFKTEMLNRTTHKPVRVAQVEKIPKPTLGSSSTTTAYDELVMNATSGETSHITDTKKRIDRLLRKYLNQLYLQKYQNNTSNPNQIRPLISYPSNLTEGESYSDNTKMPSDDSKIRPSTRPKISVGQHDGTKRRPNSYQSTQQLAEEESFSESENIRPSSYSKLTEGDYPEGAKSQIPESIWDFKNKKINKIKKLFSVFTVVKFNNTQCNATSSTGSYLGVCYTSAECTSNDGWAVGDCARGYGVCCVLKGTCGGQSSQNCSYFQSPNYPDFYPSGNGVIVPTTLAPPTTANPSPTPDPRLTWYRFGRQSDDATSCVFSVTKANDDVNKMRIDFIDFELTGPRNGTCNDERLVITGQNVNNRVPVICGYNTGQHVYVDVSMLSGALRISVLSNGMYRKRFNIRICQFSESCLEPASDCLQYYTGIAGTISSFNYDQAASFNRSIPGYYNNLNYAICIRREAGYCSITYTNVLNGVEYPFQLVNVRATGVSTIPRGQAGAGVTDCPDDYIVIDGVRLCGDKFNDGTVNRNASQNAAVTDTSAGPIVVPVRTNAAVTGLGFKLFYTQNLCPSSTRIAI